MTNSITQVSAPRVNQAQEVTLGKNGAKSTGNFFSRQQVLNVYDFYLDDAVSDVTNYRDLCQILIGMQETDTLNIYINSPGGLVDTMVQIVNLIQNCPGTVIGHLVGPSASAACSIFLACHAWMVYPNSMLMGHTYRGASYGKGKNEIQHYHDKFNEFFEEMMLDLYYPFFTEEEMDQMIEEGKDIWLTSKEVSNRVNILADYRLSQVKAIEDAESK